jgi:predicted tellurium resistance membrane protein TerC
LKRPGELRVTLALAPVAVKKAFRKFAGKISDFIHKHPSLKMLALSFLMLIGCALVAEGFHKEIPKGYIYFAMAFSVGVEALNIRVRTKKKVRPVELHEPFK